MTPVARWFAWYFRRLAARHFAGVHWNAAEDPAEWGPTPVLVVANHSTWWDGPLAYLLSRELGRPFNVAMEARHLERHPYFNWIGAHPIRRTTMAERYADIEWLGATLVPGGMLWIFPQGERRPAAASLRLLERGAAHLALSRAPVRIVPVGIRLAHLSEQRPDAFLRVGPSWIVGPRDQRDRVTLTEDIGLALARTLRESDALIAGELLGSWRPVLEGALSLNKRIEQVRRLAGLSAGTFVPRNG